MAWRQAEVVARHGDITLEKLLEKLRKGSRWLTKQHQRHYADDPNRCSVDKLAEIDSAWGDLEMVLRQVHSYSHCIFGEGQRCPEAGPLRCSACAERTE